MCIRALIIAFVWVASASAIAHASELRVLAAGSLREVIGAIAAQYRQETGVEVTAAFGPSGVLRERIEQGERVDLFASADMGHPLKLLADGRATRIAMFTRNALCGIARSKVGLTRANFLDRLLDPAVKLGTSTPQADPAGDYTWAMFHLADGVHGGAYATLDKKAQKVVGGPPTGKPVGGQDPVASALSSGQIDVMIGYCSGEKRLSTLIPDLQFVEPPREIATGPEYGLAVLKGADPRTADLALFMLSPEAQQLFAQNGFAPVGLPQAAPGAAH